MTRRPATTPTTRARRAARPRDDAARRGRARGEPRDPARPVAPGVPRARSSRAGRAPASSSTSGPAISPGLVLRRPFSLNTADLATGIVTIHFRVIGRGTEWFTRLRPGDAIDLLGPLGRPFEVDPRSRHLLLIAGGLGHGRRPDARRRGDPRRPPGDAAVRRSERPRGLPVEPPARRGRVRRRDRRRLARPPRVRDRPRARLRGLGRPGLRLRSDRRCSRRSRGRRRAAGGDSAWRSSAASAARGRADSARFAGGAPEGVPPGVDGAEHGLCRRRVPGLRRDERDRARRSASAAKARSSRAEELAWEGAWS